MALELVGEWKSHVENTGADALVFSTRIGTTISPNNVLRRFIFPACKRLGLPRATWLTLRRTYSSWSHDRGVPGKVVAQLMGHANVDTTLNVYTQVLDGSLREAVEKVGERLRRSKVKGQRSKVKGQRRGGRNALRRKGVRLPFAF